MLALVGLLAAVAVMAALAAACGSSGGSTGTAPPRLASAAKMFKIGVTQIVTHPALDASVQGFQEEMAAKGFVEGQNVTYDLENAQGDMSTAAAIARSSRVRGSTSSTVWPLLPARR